MLTGTLGRPIFDLTRGSTSPVMTIRMPSCTTAYLQVTSPSASLSSGVPKATWVL